MNFFLQLAKAFYLLFKGLALTLMQEWSFIGMAKSVEIWEEVVTSGMSDMLKEMWTMTIFSWVYFVGVFVLWVILVLSMFLCQIYWLIFKMLFGDIYIGSFPIWFTWVNNEMGDTQMLFYVFASAMMSTFMSILLGWLLVKVFWVGTSLTWWYWKKVLSLDD